MMSVDLAPFSFDRMARAVDKVRDRLLRSAGALEAAGVPYAVVGGNAVAAWVSRVDESAARNTRDVDILIRLEDFDRVKLALESSGFHYRHTSGLDTFLDGPEAKARDGVRVVFANEVVREGELSANPDVDESVDAGGYRIIGLEGLVRIKLTAIRDKDRTHIRDMIDVGLVDESWCDRLGPPLSARLKSLIETPGG